MEELVHVGTDVTSVLRRCAEENLLRRAFKRSRMNEDIRALHSRLTQVVRTADVRMISALSLFPPSRIPTAARGPWQLPNCDLPSKPQIFFGRDSEVDLLIQALIDNTAAHLAILGPGGMGKTTIATAVLHNDRVVRGKSGRKYCTQYESSIARPYGYHRHHRVLMISQHMETWRLRLGRRKVAI
ncbi:hypothetical protein CALVIDRAFT_541846 [Calocera viscosa TUFC12733]|uniref:NB-ARC domain-containing protein n=1 Tax=Calocera viscosa (strain TUFC12733) TaxID=1330018 RepID=A0A167HB87_CALVF|nr:hypothetical protein CALVIDRAFT_541846 [Calocera viscosa TUFC12733]